MSTSKQETLTHKLQAVDRYSKSLYQKTEAAPWQNSQLVFQCLEELRSALEELKVAEEELREQNEALASAQQTIEEERHRYHELFEFAPDGYLVTDPYGIVRETNRVAASLLQIDQSRLVGKPLANYVVEGQRRSFRYILNQLPSINRLQEWEVVMQGRQGIPFSVALTVEVVQERGQPTGLRWLMRDITARKHAEEQLYQTQLRNMQLVEADRLKSQFMATLSHELRTPMNAILGFSEVLLRQFHQRYDPQMVGMVERIFRNGKHLLFLIEEMLDFSKLKAQRMQLYLEPFDLVELLQTTVEELYPLAEQKALEVRVETLQPNLLITNDKSRFRQIVTNLLSNAIKFTETGSVRLIVEELPQDRIAVTVQDTGIGIDLVDQDHIFQEFWQVNQTITRCHSGTGLGLAIVQALVQLMQGKIEVESEPGKGSSFRIEFPRWVQQSALLE